jgi:hypothetical protein
MKEIITEIIINASATKVWNVLMDFENYPEWNPFIISIEGSGEKGASLLNKIKIKEKISTFKPIVLANQKSEKFEWEGKLPLGMFNGRHTFIIETLHDQQVKLIHKEKFTGWLSGLIFNQIQEDTRNGFIEMNRALKNKVES